MIRADNQRLKEELRELKGSMKEADTIKQHVPVVERKKPKKDSRKLPGLYWMASFITLLVIG